MSKAKPPIQEDKPVKEYKYTTEISQMVPDPSLSNVVIKSRLNGTVFRCSSSVKWRIRSWRRSTL